MQDNYVNQILSIIQQAKADAKAEAEQELKERMFGALGQTQTKKKKSASFATASAALKKAKKGGRRSPEEMEQLTRSLLAHIKKNPGQRIEPIAQALEVGAKELALPVKKLWAEKAITTKGQRRGTTYYAKG
jgi:hypothetical protein